MIVVLISFFVTIAIGSWCYTMGYREGYEEGCQEGYDEAATELVVDKKSSAKIQEVKDVMNGLRE